MLQKNSVALAKLFSLSSTSSPPLQSEGTRLTFSHVWNSLCFLTQSAWHAWKVTPGTWDGYCWNKGCDAMEPTLSFLLEKVLCLSKYQIYWKGKAIEVFETSWIYEGNMGWYQTLRSSSDCLGCGKSRISQIKSVVGTSGQISGVHSLNYSKVMDQEHKHKTQHCLSHHVLHSLPNREKNLCEEEKASFLSLSLSLPVSVPPVGSHKVEVGFRSVW